MKYLIALLLSICTLACHAAIYMQVDKNGNTTYSDTPLSRNAKKITLPGSGGHATSSITSKSAAPSSEDIKEPQMNFSSKDSINTSYTTLSILSPKDQETIQNQPVIRVKLKLEPKLQSGDKIQLFIDGKPEGKPLESTELEVSQIPRGTHQMYAAIIDYNQKIVKTSNSVTIYVHHASVSSTNVIRK